MCITPSVYERLTEPGPAAIAVLRLRGPAAGDFLRRQLTPASDLAALRPGCLRRRRLIDAAGEQIDDVLLSVHRGAPAWDVRLHLHGSVWLVGHCERLLERVGLTRCQGSPAGLWPAADRVMADACATLPRMLTERGCGWLLGQAKQLRAELATLRDANDLSAARARCAELAQRVTDAERFARPLQIVLAGPPNAGKSTLLNALADRSVSLVSERPGATRDWVTASGEIDGVPVTWHDTAGLRTAADEIEAAGVAATRRLMAAADVVVLVLDATADPAANQAAREELDGVGVTARLVVWNKTDLVEPPAAPPASRGELAIAALPGRGLADLNAHTLRVAGVDFVALEQPGAFRTEQGANLHAAANAANFAEFRRLIDEMTGAATDV